MKSDTGGTDEILKVLNLVKTYKKADPSGESSLPVDEFDDRPFDIRQEEETNNKSKKKKGTKAVKGISFGVQRGEVFSLLGVNGAGKTSTFKCLVGDESVSGGTVQVANTDQRRIYGRPWRLHGMIGYCPQYNCIDPYLTVK